MEEKKKYRDWLPILEAEKNCRVMDDDGGRLLWRERRYEEEITKEEATKYFMMNTMYMIYQGSVMR